MLLIDVNVLIYAYRRESRDHAAYHGWLENTLHREPAIGLPDIVLSAVLRLLTNPRMYRAPTPLESALEYVQGLREQSACLAVAPGPKHWPIFVSLCRAAGARGNLVTDAYLAAIAVEQGAELITTDRDYARFPGRRWRHPLG